MKKNKNIFMASVLLLSLGLASCTDSFPRCYVED